MRLWIVAWARICVRNCAFGIAAAGGTRGGAGDLTQDAGRFGVDPPPAGVNQGV
jgi:hypothetical protein